MKDHGLTGKKRLKEASEALIYASLIEHGLWASDDLQRWCTTVQYVQARSVPGACRATAG